MLDLACGSGPLTALCRRRFGASVRLIGVDMSEHELSLARSRLRGQAVELHQGLAQELHFLEDASVDVVLCHWALTLMDPVEPVLREVCRVLRPRGLFAAIVDGDLARSPSYERLHHLIYDFVKAEYPAYGDIDMGDPRIRSRVALESLVGRCLDEEDSVVVEPGVVHLHDAPDALARVAAGFFYASFVLSPSARAQMLEAVTAAIATDSPPQQQQQAGRGRFSMPINRLVVRKAGRERSPISDAARRLTG